LSCAGWAGEELKPVEGEELKPVEGEELKPVEGEELKPVETVGDPYPLLGAEAVGEEAVPVRTGPEGAPYSSIGATPEDDPV